MFLCVRLYPAFYPLRRSILVSVLLIREIFLCLRKVSHIYVLTMTFFLQLWLLHSCMQILSIPATRLISSLQCIKWRHQNFDSGLFHIGPLETSQDKTWLRHMAYRRYKVKKSIFQSKLKIEDLQRIITRKLQGSTKRFALSKTCLFFIFMFGKVK